MHTLFTLLFIIFVVICSAIWAPVCFFIGVICGKKKRDRAVFRLARFVFVSLRFFSGAKVNITGLEKIPKDTPVMYVGNHRSFYDIILLYSYLPPLCGFVAKESLFKIPVLRFWMKYMNCIGINRTDPREGLKSILAAIDHIKEGISVFIFPEGTRGPSDDSVMPYKEGSFKIATKSGCMVVPVALNNTAQIFENHMPFVKKAKVNIEILDPVNIKDLPDEFKKEPGKYFHDLVENTMLKNKVNVQ